MSGSTFEFVREDTADGAAFVIGTDDRDIVDRLKQAADGTTDTPTPETDTDDGVKQGGPIERFTNVLSPLRMGLLEQIGLSGHEIANAVQTRVSELYRNQFPVIEPRFERTCADCGSEYDERVEECVVCDSTDLREPDPAEKQRAAELIERVNKEGQSLRDLGKSLEWDQWLTGVPVVVLRHEYTIAPSGAVADAEVDELVKGDPKRLVPVVDENRRIGGHWWACPRCRITEDYDPEDAPGVCPECGAHLQEVYFAEYGDDGDDVDSYYFEREILTFPWAFPRLHGLDGLAPVHHVWLKQLIIDLQDRYAAAFYDPDSDRLPNQFIVLHTTNPDAWEERLQAARETAKDDEYDSPVFTNKMLPEQNATPEVQVVDAMPDELLGQNQELRETFKKDIRRATNISDVHDNDTKDAGGLNNEGLQIEVTDRPTATQMHDYESGWLDELGKRLGIDDWRFRFIPATGPEAEDLQVEVEAGLQAEQAGLDARLTDGQVSVADGEFDPAEPAPDAEAPGGPPMGAADRGGDNSSHDYGPEETATKAGGSGNAPRGTVQKVESVPDNAVSIQDPSEAPEDAQVVTGPRGGTYYVSDGGSPPADRGDVEAEVRELIKDGDRAELESYVSSKTGIPDVTIPDFPDDEDAVEFASTLSYAGELGLTESVETLNTNTPGSAHGVYNFTENRLSFENGVSSDELEGNLENGYAVGEGMEWLVLHEIGHAQHETTVGADEEIFESGLAVSRDGEWIGRGRVDLVDEKVSTYARSNPGELVAEVFAGLALGQEFPDDVMDIYEEWDGPRTWREYHGED